MGDDSRFSSDGPTPSPAELAVWRLFLRAHAHASRLLEADLLAAHDLPLTSYDVLVQLVEAPGRRLRMTELADRVLLSRSGLTRMVDRLTSDGLVVREPCETDARGSFAVLTDFGYERLREASRTHLRGVKAYVTSMWDGPTLTGVGVAMSLVLGEGPTDSEGPAETESSADSESAADSEGSADSGGGWRREDESEGRRASSG